MRLFQWTVTGLLLTAGAVAACSSDATTNNSSSSSSSGSATGDAGSTLYTRLGGNAGISKALDAIITAELADPEIASYFVFQTEMNPPAGHPNVTQIHDCFVNLLANAAGGTEKYPTTVTGNFTCGAMKEAHTGLGIPNGVFDHFVAIAAGVLQTAGVASADITTIGTVLNGTKADIVQDTSRDGGNFDLDASH